MSNTPKYINRVTVTFDLASTTDDLRDTSGAVDMVFATLHGVGVRNTEFEQRIINTKLLKYPPRLNTVMATNKSST